MFSLVFKYLFFQGFAAKIMLESNQGEVMAMFIKGVIDSWSFTNFYFILNSFFIWLFELSF